MSAMALWGLFLAVRSPYMENPLFSEFYLVFTIMVLPCVFGQYMFGFEANYMDGIWTRPVKITDIMRAKYYAYAVEALVMTIAAYLICYFFSANLEITLGIFLSPLIYTIGVFNNMLFFACLFNSRYEMYSSSLTIQGSKGSFHVALILIVPIAFLLCMYILLPLQIANYIAAALGSIGILIHPLSLSWIAKRYESSRYTHFEKYRD
jgi:hypothetical protein